jgi:hypothetical protein
VISNPLLPNMPIAASRINTKATITAHQSSEMVNFDRSFDILPPFYAHFSFYHPYGNIINMRVLQFHRESTNMHEKDEEIHALSQYLIDEIIMAFGLKKTTGSRRLFTFLLNKVTTRLATICVMTDRKIATDGFPVAAGWMARHWVREVRTRGAASVPATGPLLVVSNHVGAYDILVVPSQINRRDVKIIASDSPFFKNLRNASRQMIYASADPGSRMAAARQGVAHLREGGALLLFGTGLIDPDPEVYPHAELAVGNWSPSIDLFLRQVPQTQLIISILSGIVMPRWAHSPLTWLRRVEWQKRRIAEYGQVMEQLFFPGKPNISPSMTIAPPIDVDELHRESGAKSVLPAVITHGKALLVDHVNWVSSQKKG